MKPHKQEEKALESYRSAIISANNRGRTEPLEDVVKRACQDDMLIITQVAHNYLPIFEIWYSYIQRFKIKNLLVIALDPLIYDRLREIGLNTYLLPIFTYQPDVEKILWFETVKLRSEINAMGIDYLHTDADAFWFTNPLEKINSIKGDIIGSMAYGTPIRLVEKWGFVLCCGFYMMRSTSSTQNIYDRYICYSKKFGQDQNALNNLLAEYCITWMGEDDSSRVGRCEKLNLDVHVLPEQVVSRFPECLSWRKPADVFHPFLGSGTIGKRVELLKSMGINKLMTDS